MTITLDQLVASLDRNFGQINAVVDFLPRFVVEDNDINIEIDGAQAIVPTLKKLTRAINTAAFTSRLEAMELAGDDNASRIKALISQLYMLTGKNGPFWDAFDLTGKVDVGDNQDPTYRAHIENGLRFPFDAYYISQFDKKEGSSFVKLGSTLMPPYSESLVAGWGDGSVENTEPKTVLGASSLDIAAYPGFNKTAVYARDYWMRMWSYYGYYWYYWNYYYSAFANQGIASQLNEYLNGSQTAQTFNLAEDRIVTAIKVWAHNAVAQKTNKPRLILCETSYGMPDLNKVLALGNVVEDANYNSGAITAATGLLRDAAIRFNLTEPVYIKSGVSYALVFVAPASYKLWAGNNQSSRGGVFYTQDGAMWTQDITKDVIYDLVAAQFSAGENIVELPALTLAGGIASVKTYVKSIVPTGTSYKLQVAVNSTNWQDLGVLNNLDNLPPYSPVRAVFACTSKLTPLIDTLASTITAFRPAAEIKFISLPRTSRKGSTNLALSFSLAGFDYELHTLSIKLKKQDGTLLEPQFRKDTVSDKTNGIVDVGFVVPAGEPYRLVIVGKTLTATRVFDILNIIEV